MNAIAPSARRPETITSSQAVPRRRSHWSRLRWTAVLALSTGVIMAGSEARATPTKVTFTGIIAANTILPKPIADYGLSEGSQFSLTFEINPNYNTTQCASYVAASTRTSYNDSLTGCTTPLLTNLSFSNSSGTFNSAAGVGNIMRAYAFYSAPTNRNLEFSTRDSLTAQGTTLCTTNNSSCLNLTSYDVAANYVFTYFPSVYMQPNNSPPIMKPADLIQFYYSSSYYRDYTISASPNVNARVIFRDPLDPESPAYQIGFDLRGMDIVNGVPGPIPVLGGASAFAWSRRLRRRLQRR